MANKTFHSSTVTFLDRTDERKLEVYISSNHPTVQIKNQNTGEYTPDWSTTNLQLSADVFIDSQDVTADSQTTINWYTKIGNTETFVGKGESLKISTNALDINPIITYVCKAAYQNVNALSQVTFTRADTGRNGTDGTPAPAVQAQYSTDGAANWTVTLNAATHKYIRYSYDGGKTWTTAIKMVGEDGTSVKIKGTATSKSTVSGTSYYTLVYNSTTITGAAIGDAYLLDGNMYVCVDSRDGNDYFMDVGHIQGPQGNDGQSSYVFIRYATDTNGANMAANPTSTTTHIGICTVNTNIAPTTASSYTWSKFVGDNAKSIILSGTSQIFKVSSDVTPIYTPTTIKVTAQTVNTTVATWEYSVNGGINWTTTVPAGVSLDANTSTLTITGKNLTSNSLVIKASNGVYKDVYTVSKVFDGATGATASMAFLTNENISFSANANGQVALMSFTTNVVAYDGTTKVTPKIGTISGLPSGMTVAAPVTTANEQILTFSIANNSTLGSTSSNSGAITIPVTSPVSANLILSWSKINTGAKGDKGDDGGDAYTVMLTNEAYTFAGDVDHAYADEVTTQIIGYKGSTQQSVGITSVNGKTAAIIDTETGIPGLKFKCSALSAQNPIITFTCTEAFTSASGSIPIVISIDGVSFTRMFNYSIAFKGAIGGTGDKGDTGSPATAYWLVSSASVVHKTSTGIIAVTPSTLTFTGKSKTGTSAPIDYGCRWIIDCSTDGTTYTNLYTSTANEVSKTITVATTHKTIRVRMYLAGGTTTLLDEQIIPVVSDGAKGDVGIGINSVTVDYGVSTSASTQPTSWHSTIQTAAEGSYLWTRTITDYTDNSMADTVTYTYAKQGKTPVKGTDYVDGTSVTVSSIQYQASISATTAPTGTWSDDVVPVAEGSYLWTKTKFSDEKVAYGVAKQGKSGADAYTVLLTNESHVFAGNVSSAVASSATTQVLAYKGTTAQSVTIVSINGVAAKTASTATGIAGLTFACSALSGTSPTITFTCTTSFVSPNGSIPIVLSVGGVTITKMFAYSIAFKGTTGTPGSPGTPASLVDVTPSAHYFKSTTGKDGTFTPDYIYLYPRFQTVTYNKWEYSTNGGTSWTAVTSGSNGLTIGTYNSVANSLQIAATSALYTDSITSISFRCVSSNASVYDTVSIAKIYDVVDLQIGGRNLLRWTQGLPITTTRNGPDGISLYSTTIGDLSATDEGLKLTFASNSSTSMSIPLATDGCIENGEMYTLSFDYRGNITYPGSVFFLQRTTPNESIDLASISTLIANETEWQHYEATFSSNSINNRVNYQMLLFYGLQSYTSDNWIEVKKESLKLEKGNKKTAWTPAIEDVVGTPGAAGADAVTFQVYSSTGYALSTNTPTATLQTFAYIGDIAISAGATYQWYEYSANDWVAISGATDPYLNVGREDVAFSKNYKCIMTFNGTQYVGIVTLDDKNDTNKIFTTKPSNYAVGDIWIVGVDYAPSGFEVGTLLRAEHTNTSYADNDWITALKYDEKLNKLQESLETYDQYFSFDSTDGLRISARDANGVESQFSTSLTNEKLSFNYGNESIAYINGTKMNIKEAEIESPLTVTGKYSGSTMLQAPVINIGNFSLIVESNGSLSIVVNT